MKHFPFSFPPPSGGNRYREFISYLWISLIVALFNLIAVFGSKILILDDLMTHRWLMLGGIPKGYAGYFVLTHYREWMVWNIVAFSPELARALYVVFLMIPISFCLYYLFHKKLGFPRTVSIVSAILPNVLPFQWRIPASLNLSYSLWGLLFSLLALISGLNFLGKNDKRKWIWFVLSLLLYFLALDFNEQSLFIFPVIILVFLGNTRFNKKHAFLISSFSILAVLKFFWAISVSRKPITELLSIEEIINRTGLYLKWSLPAPDIQPVYLFVFFSVVLVAGFILLIVNRDTRIIVRDTGFAHMTRNRYTVFLYTVLLSWYGLSSFVFVFMHKQVMPRHAQFPSMVSNLLLVFSLYVILNRGILKKYRVPVVVLAAMILFSGLYRYTHLTEKFSPKNNAFRMISDHLQTYRFPLNSQIVVSGVRGPPPGFNYSSGYLKFTLKRKDIDGLIGAVYPSGYYNFYNHFDPTLKGHNARTSMTGLSVDRPSFFFIRDKGDTLRRLEYALQWDGKSAEAEWSLLQSEKKTGRISAVTSGKGWKEYVSALDERELDQSQVLWGGPPFITELKRMGLDRFLYSVKFENRFMKIGRSRAEEILEEAAKFTSLLRKKIDIGSKFELVSSFSVKRRNNNGSVSRLVYFVLRSIVEHQNTKSQLQVMLVDNRDKLRSIPVRFSEPGAFFRKGDFVFGSVKIDTRIGGNAPYTDVRYRARGEDPESDDGIQLFFKPEIIAFKHVKHIRFTNFGWKSGPFPKLKLPRIRWGLGPESRICFRSEEKRVLNFQMEYSNIMKGQELDIRLNGKSRFKKMLKKSSMGDLKKISFRAPVKKGENCIRLIYSKWKKEKNRRPLSLIFTAIKVY